MSPFCQQLSKSPPLSLFPIPARLGRCREGDIKVCVWQGGVGMLWGGREQQLWFEP